MIQYWKNTMSLPIFKVRVANKTGYQLAYEGDSINLEQPSSTTRRGRVGYGVANTLNTQPHQAVVVKDTHKVMTLNIRQPNGLETQQQDRIYDTNGCMTAISSQLNGRFNVMESTFRIRKLTPYECYILMGFDKESFLKAQAVNSNNQLYKQAGNSIVVNVLEAIFTNLFKGGV